MHAPAKKHHTGTVNHMNKGLAIYFAIMGTVLLAASAGSFSFRNTAVSVTLILLTICHIGLGFVVRARQRRKS